MTASSRRVAKRWADVGSHDLVEIKGRLYAVVKAKRKGDDVKVTIRDPQSMEEYTSKVKAKHGVDVVELVKRKRQAWKKPDGEAEKNVVEILGAELVAVKPSADEWYVCPPVDISTIAAHLYILHGISPVDVQKPGGYDEAVALHAAEHEKPAESILNPHTHERDRPVVGTGPRFT